MTDGVTRWVALLRAVNVGGTGKLLMADFAACCSAAGFGNVRTYIQSGNAVFTAPGNEQSVIAALEQALFARTGLQSAILVRSSAEMQAIAAGNPFAGAEPPKIYIAFLPAAPTPAFLALGTPGGEIIRPGLRELYVQYPEGMGRSKLKLPAGCTVRNLNTVSKLAAMAAGA